MGSPGGGQHFLKWGKRKNTFVTKVELIICVQPGPCGVPLILQQAIPEFVMLTGLISFLTSAENHSTQRKPNKTKGVRFLKGRGGP